jgi:dolichyl-phosphate beta-glucosyltransferase
MQSNSESHKPSLSVILPAFNEEHRLPDTLKTVRSYLESRFPVHEVIVVDDGSSDRTPVLVERMREDWPFLRLLRQPRNMGKGAALKRGCLAASCDLVLFMDADLATPIEEVELMLPHLKEGGYRVVAGIRTYQEDEHKWRRIVGLSLQILAHLIVFEKAVIDSQCGFKCFTNAAAKELFSRSQINGGMIDVELFFLMHRLGIPVYYQPVHWKNKPGSRINLVRCILMDPVDLVAIRLRGMLGTYQKSSQIIHSRS